MSEVITRLGENRIAQCQAAGELLTIDQFVLSYDPALDPTADIDRDSPLPPAEQIVHTQGVSKAGYINTAQVVYSLLMEGSVGPFQFNRLDLVESATDSNIAISTVATQHKVLGEAMTRNVITAYSSAAAISNISVAAASWQLDLTSRLNASDQLERFSTRDIWGRSCFWEDGFKVTGAGNDYQLAAGRGYVEGIRIQSDGSNRFATDTMPIDVWLDVSLQGDSSGVQPKVAVLLSNGQLADSSDGQHVYHFVEKIASLDGVGNITDLRNSKPVGNSMLGYIDRYPLLNDPTLAENLADAIASQQAVKGYVDASVQSMPTMAACSVVFPNYPSQADAYLASKTALISHFDYIDTKTLRVHLTQPIAGAMALVSLLGTGADSLGAANVIPNAHMITDSECQVTLSPTTSFSTLVVNVNFSLAIIAPATAAALVKEPES